MTKRARFQIPDLDPNRPKVPDAVPLIVALYRTDAGGAGCCLHVLLDDGNYDCAKYCLTYAREVGHPDCVKLAEMLSQMSGTQVRKASRLADEVLRRKPSQVKATRDKRAFGQEASG